MTPSLLITRCASPLLHFSLPLILCLGVISTTTQARVTKIVIDQTISPAFCKAGQCPPNGSVGAYEQLSGRAFGELDPKDPLNAIVQDINLSRDSDGKVRYVASFVITKPVDLNKASGLLWHDVPNRGRPVDIASQEITAGDIGLASA
jgi:hypothetical protein